MPRQSQHQYEAFGASTTATWLTYGTASDCTRQHCHERASGHVSNAMVQKENSAGKKSVQKENSAERTQETTKTVENTHRSPWPLCSVTTVQKKKEKNQQQENGENSLNSLATLFCCMSQKPRVLRGYPWEASTSLKASKCQWSAVLSTASTSGMGAVAMLGR